MDHISFYKMQLVTYNIFSYNTTCKFHGWVNTTGEWILWVNEYHGKISLTIPWVDKYHGWMPFTIPWVNSMCGWIPWVGSIYNTIGKFHGWMDNMGGWTPWLDAFSIQIIPPSLRSSGPHCVKFPLEKPLLNMKSHLREWFYVVNSQLWWTKIQG